MRKPTQIATLCRRAVGASGGERRWMGVKLGKKLVCGRPSTRDNELCLPTHAAGL
jgi:hypothetical protein